MVVEICLLLFRTLPSRQRNHVALMHRKRMVLAGKLRMPKDTRILNAEFVWEDKAARAAA